MGVGYRCADLLMTSKPMGIGSRCADPADLQTLELSMGSKRGRGYKQYNPVYKQYKQYNPANLPTLDTTYGVRGLFFM